MECLTLAETMSSVEQQREEMRRFAEIREQENQRKEEEYRQKAEELQQQFQEQEQRKKAYLERIAEMQRERQSMRSTHEAQVGHLTSKLQCLQLESKEDMQLRKELQQFQDSLKKAEMDIENMRLKEQVMVNQLQEKDLQNQEKTEELAALNRELKDLEDLGQKDENQQYTQLKAVIDQKMRAMGYKFGLEDLMDMQLQCQFCAETFVQYEPEPDFFRMEEYKFNIQARKDASTYWKENVRAKFFVRLDCLGGCSGICLACAEKQWLQEGKNARRLNVATRKCPYCRTQWRSKPQPFVQHLR
eukprot:TRINITY_DN1460_c0_g1_i12.p2 TRINITY_DN1460_c0_g1~~TRINITY_DN1460_c0_g1_i12.p2  ORF type:complete len:319 (-),score=52.85 TRINITY_DN1460_c0_g1_i12:468-1373(-)